MSGDYAPDGLTDLQRLIMQRMMGLGPTCRLSVEDFRSQFGYDAKTIRRVRTMMARRFDIDPQSFYDPTNSHKSRGLLQYSPRGVQSDNQGSGSGGFAMHALVAFADPDLVLDFKEVSQRITCDQDFFPSYMRRELAIWKTNAPNERVRFFRRSRLQIERWIEAFKGCNNPNACPLCSGISDRRPIPGICAVCKEPGAEEVLERPSAIGSSAGIATERA